jgi:hypothetical protein
LPKAPAIVARKGIRDSAIAASVGSVRLEALVAVPVAVL